MLSCSPYIFRKKSSSLWMTKNISLIIYTNNIETTPENVKLAAIAKFEGFPQPYIQTHQMCNRLDRSKTFGPCLRQRMGSKIFAKIEWTDKENVERSRPKCRPEGDGRHRSGFAKNRKWRASSNYIISFICSFEIYLTNLILRNWINW